MLLFLRRWVWLAQVALQIIFCYICISAVVIDNMNSKNGELVLCMWENKR